MSALTERARAWRLPTWPPAPSSMWRSAFGWLLGLVALATVALVLVPLLTAVVRAFFDDGTINFSAFREVAELPGLATTLINTIILVLAAGAIALAVGASFAWLNERSDARMGLLSDVLPLIPLFVPPIAGAIGWVFLLAPRAGLLNVVIRAVVRPFGVDLLEGPFDVFSWYGLVLASSLYLIPYVYLVVSAALRNLDPSLEEASHVSGAGRLRTLWRVALPAIRPALASGFLLILVIGFALFSVPTIIGKRAGIDVLSVRIVEQLITRYPARTDVAMVLSGIVLVVIAGGWVLQRRIARAGQHATLGGRGSRAQRARLGPWRWVARGGMVIYMLMAAILPVTALVIVSGQGFWTANVDWSAWNLDNYREVLFENPGTQAALQRSVILAITAGLAGMLVAALVSTLARRSRSVFARFADGVVKLPAALSHIVIAIGFIIALSGPPVGLHGTLTLLFLAYIVLYLPQASVASDAAIAQIGDDLLEASYSCGASESRTFGRIQLPLMASGLASGWALLFVLMVGDLTASAMLASSGNATVGFAILDLWEGGVSFPRLAAFAVVMTVVTTTVITLSMWTSRHRFSVVSYQ